MDVGDKPIPMNVDVQNSGLGISLAFRIREIDFSASRPISTTKMNGNRGKIASAPHPPPPHERLARRRGRNPNERYLPHTCTRYCVSLAIDRKANEIVSRAARDSLQISPCAEGKKVSPTSVVGRWPSGFPGRVSCACNGRIIRPSYRAIR